MHRFLSRSEVGARNVPAVFEPATSLPLPAHAPPHSSATVSRLRAGRPVGTEATVRRLEPKTQRVIGCALPHNRRAGPLVKGMCLDSRSSLHTTWGSYGSDDTRLWRREPAKVQR
jgi:hypothetical protein